MDILRKELNGIYAAQHLDTERLEPAMLNGALADASVLARVGSSCAVVTDASRDRCYIYAGGFGILMGLSAGPRADVVFDSSDEDEIYNRIHPEDLVDKRMLEYEFFKMAHHLPPSEKTAWKATCRLRMLDADGIYRYIDNSTQVAHLSPSGTIWLILCRYDLSATQSPASGIEPHIVNNRTGRITALQLGERRGRVLTVREKEILRMIQGGMASKQIAAALGISLHTVNRHRQNIIEKLSVGNSVEAVAAATAMNLL